MQNNTNNKVLYYLGIDAGGTKTDFLLTDTNGNEICSTRLSACNPNDIGFDAMRQVLHNGISQTCKNVPLEHTSLFAGIAGGITGNNQQLIHKFLCDFGFACFENGSDADNVISMTLGDEDGVAVIMGTGIVAFSQCNGIRRRIGGWGYLFDTGGSGYHIAANAVTEALQYLDAKGGSETLYSLFTQNLGKPLQDCIAEFYSKGKAYIASFSPLVFEAYRQGDDHAQQIIDRNVKEAAVLIHTAMSHLNRQNAKIFICGGLSNERDCLLPFFQKYIPENTRLIFSTEAPVKGAVRLAEKIASGTEINKC